MKRMSAILLGLIFGIFIFTPFSAFGNKIAGIDLGVSVPDGVYCEINEVKLFALTAQDCEKAGGVVTHTVTTEVKEIGQE